MSLVQGKPIKLIECPRDAWQGMAGRIPPERKVEYLKALIAAGFKHLDAVSFVSPKAVPQMADSEEVLRQLDPPDDVEIIGVVLNQKGAERAIATGKVKTLGFPYSVSPTFLEKNQNQSPEENAELLEKVAEMAFNAGLEVLVYISMAFGNPYGDPWEAEEVLEALGMIADLDVRAVSLADTVGLATPARVAELIGAAQQRFDWVEIGAHLHARREQALEKVLAAYDAGCRRFESSLGGLGGCPFAQDELVGNIPTEIVLQALAQRQVHPSIRPLDSLLTMASDIAVRYGKS